ncbi:MAG: response regulator [Cyclobacteriaceae bacterium]|nr:response regulator [Cyclobacteriaceae bacterium]
MKLQQYVKKGSFYEAVVEDGSDIIFIVDYDGKIRYHNSSVRETLGYNSKSLIGKNFFDYILPETLSALKSKFKQSQKRAYTEKVEFQFLCKDRSYRFLEFNAINLKHKEKLNGFILDCRDITQRKMDAVELVRLQKAKEQFLANISHEIRTPINGIAGMASLLEQNPTADERETYLSAIRHSAENLKVIINDLLDLSAIESGKLRLEKIPFNLKDILPSLISTFTYQAREKKIALEYHIDERLNKILLGDPVRLNQILINLISNAVKFTHHGSIRIDCTVDRQQKDTCWVRIEVKDTGVGIPDEKLNTIFESFSQADASVTRRYGGSGLGLTIVKQLVELQRGRITVRSEEHIGSTFIVLIPYSIGKTRSLAKSVQAASKSLADVNAQNLRVLLVEDNDINRLYAKSILKNWQCFTDTAENGLVAIEKIKSDSFDVVLMDVQMPVMDGYEATQAIRLMDSPLNSIPIIALTANATKADVEKCMAAGMNDYLPKPFTPEDLHRKLFEDLKITPVKDANERKRTNRKSAFDFSYLRSVSGNNEEFIKEMIQTFAQNIPIVVEDMRTSIQHKNWENLSRLAHQIKPSFILMGLERMKSTLIFIEENGKEKTNLDELVMVATNFIATCEGFIPQLKEELASV